jgi:pyridinium-3,5-bisthiocarboxylic acid mononucleotide nickel chelatase
VRLWIGEAIDLEQSNSTTLPQYIETVRVLETQIDDLNPQAIGYIFDILFQAGAVEVFTQPIGMKKSRPGILLTVICHPDKLAECEEIIFRETTTLGIRHRSETRSILPREIQTVNTQYGPVGIKIARSNQIDRDEIINIQPEYADCARIAAEFQLPWREVHQLALAAFQLTKSSGLNPRPLGGL